MSDAWKDPAIVPILEKEGFARIEPHYHITERGVLVRCYHGTRSLLTNWQFWAGLTLGFPVEHLIWEKLWPFSLVTQWLGL